MPEYHEELIEALNLKLCKTQVEMERLKMRINALITENEKLKRQLRKDD